jgi:hypothetical protein
VRRRRVLLDEPQDVDAVRPLHLQVRDQDVESLLHQPVDDRLAAREGLDLEPALLESGLEPLADDGLVVEDEDPELRFHRSRRPFSRRPGFTPQRRRTSPP